MENRNHLEIVKFSKVWAVYVDLIYKNTTITTPTIAYFNLQVSISILALSVPLALNDNFIHAYILWSPDWPNLFRGTSELYSSPFPPLQCTERTFNSQCIWHRVKVFIGDCGGTQNKYAICELKCAAMGFYIDGQGKRLPNSHSSYPRSCLIGIQITLFRVIISALKAIKLEISDAFPEKITRLREGRRST